MFFFLYYILTKLEYLPNEEYIGFTTVFAVTTIFLIKKFQDIVTVLCKSSLVSIIFLVVFLSIKKTIDYSVEESVILIKLRSKLIFKY